MMNDLFYQDYLRARPNASKFNPRDLRCHELKYLYLSRKYDATKNALLKKITLKRILKCRRKYGIELNTANIDGGILLVHPWCITMHNEAKIGKNATLFKGTTIGIISQGKRKGVPTIGDNVIIYANATICGNVHVGNNVIISAGAFVNFDVPDNSIVIGNPGTIHRR